jgi:hypothetical protein
MYYIYGGEINFLPISAINSLATRENIEAVIKQDPGLRTIHFSDYSRYFFSNRVYKYAPRMFVVVMLGRLGMNFLRVLMREPRTVH